MEGAIEVLHLKLFFPSKNTFPSISTTGSRCELMCKHCLGFYLKDMVDASNEGLYQCCMKAKENGAKGALLSGGSNSDGMVPYDLEDLQRCLSIKDFITNLHLGLVDEIKRQYKGANKVSVDLPPSDNVIRNIYNLKENTMEDYFSMLELLEEEKINYAPHLCVGLDRGRISGEEKVLERLESFSSEQLVILTLKRTPNASATKNRLEISEYEKILKKARDRFKYLSLGCMRDREREKEKLWLYFDKIAWPSKIIKDEMQKNGIVCQIYDTCCSV